MRRVKTTAVLLTAAVALAACENTGANDVNRAMEAVNAIDDNNLSDIMLTAADPAEAVAYFTRAVGEKPDRVDLKRNLAISLVRARRPADALPVWERVIATPEATPSDRVEHAETLIRLGRWDEAEAALAEIPPTYESFGRYRLAAMIADSNEDWESADAFYRTAAGMTAEPAGVLNNWGFSNLSRGDYPEAERLFVTAIQHDPTLFTAKNNLVMARAAQRNYQLPIVEMTQVERAQLLHTAALSAIKQGDVTLGRGLLQEAVDTHPQHFEAAVRALRALDANVTN